jgi:ribosomal protein S18 acetylase RimI-like enzyme
MTAERWIATETPLDRELRAKNVRAALARQDAALFVAVDGTSVVGRAGNEAAIALYEKSGFVREGYHPKQLRRKTGEIWDVISMGLLL